MTRWNGPNTTFYHITSSFHIQLLCLPYFPCFFYSNEIGALIKFISFTVNILLVQMLAIKENKQDH